MSKRVHLGSLVHFEAVARLGSFSSAAAELNLSQGAVSQQVQALELRIGRALIVREHAKLRLTAEGMRLLPAVQSALGSISAAWEDIEHTQQRKILRVGALPTFATYWLIPRIAEFCATHRGIEVELQSLPSDFVKDSYFPKLDSVEVDVAFTYGGGAWTGMQSRRLFDERMQVACSPHYLASHPLVSLEELASCTLIQHTTRPNMWREWSSIQGPRSLRTIDGPRFEHFFMIAQAARDSIGVALLPEFVVDREVQNGSLLCPFADHLSTGMSYHVVWPKATEDNAPLRALLEWLASSSVPSNFSLQTAP